MARDYFGDQDPIGKVVTVEGAYIGGDYTVAGVLKDLPRRSSIRFDMLSASVWPAFLFQYWNAYLPTAHWRGGITVHVRLKENTSVEKIGFKNTRNGGTVYGTGNGSTHDVSLPAHG